MTKFNWDIHVGSQTPDEFIRETKSNGRVVAHLFEMVSWYIGEFGDMFGERAEGMFGVPDPP